MKIRKTGYKTGQTRFRIFPSAFLNSLGQDGTNGTLFEVVGSMSASKHPLRSSKNFKFFVNFQKKILQKNAFEVIKGCTACLKCRKNIVSNWSTLLLHEVPIVCVLISHIFVLLTILPLLLQKVGSITAVATHFEVAKNPIDMHYFACPKFSYVNLGIFLCTQKNFIQKSSTNHE